jgi:hypothetical protein
MLPHTHATAFIAIILALVAHAAVAAPPDLFVGRFVSETRQNFGSDDPGEYVIDVRKQGEQYVLTFSHKGQGMFIVEAGPCNVDSESHLSQRPPGKARTLCDFQDRNYPLPVLSYSEGGIKVPRVGTSYKTQYYARIQWAILGFRKVQ